MNKALFYSGASFLVIEALVLLAILVNSSNEAQKITAITVFAILNICAVIMMIVGALKGSE